MAKEVDAEKIRKKWRTGAPEAEIKLEIKNPTFYVYKDCTVVNISITFPAELRNAIKAAIKDVIAVDGIVVTPNDTTVAIHGEFVKTNEVSELNEFASIVHAIAHGIVCTALARHSYDTLVNKVNLSFNGIELDAARVVYHPEKDKSSSKKQEEEDE